MASSLATNRLRRVGTSLCTWYVYWAAVYALSLGMGMCGCLPAEAHKRMSCNIFTGYNQPALYVYAVAISAAGASVCDTLGLFCTGLGMRNDEGYIMQWNRVKSMGDTYVVVAQKVCNCCPACVLKVEVVNKIARYLYT